MALDVYFRDDIANILRSINIAGGMPPNFAALLAENNEPAKLAELLAVYQHGHTNALRAAAVAFGIVILEEGGT